MYDFQNTLLMKQNKNIIVTPSDIRGFEEQIRCSDNVVNGSGINGELTEDDFSDFMNCMSKQSENLNNTWICYTGYAGYIRFCLNVSFMKYGKSKLPRKLKKKMFLSKKLRKQYLPEYYETKTN